MNSKMKCPMPVPPMPAMPEPALATVAANTVVLYNADTGQIAHLHQVTTLVGGAVPSAAKMEADAQKAFAALSRGSFGTVSALHLAGRITDSLCVGKTYKVVNCALVEG